MTRTPSRPSAAEGTGPLPSQPAARGKCPEETAAARTFQETRERRRAAALATTGLTTFLVAQVLTPYEPDGTLKLLGTHQQLGLPPCGFLTIFQIPCPGCGMTTAFALVVRGDLAAGWQANSAGVVIAFVLAISMVLFSAIAFRGGRFVLRIDDIIKYAVAVAAIAAASRWLFVVGPKLLTLTN